MNKMKNVIIISIALLTLVSCTPIKKVTLNPCVSNSSLVTQRIVDSAACALDQMREEMDGPIINHLLEEARAVFIFPDVYKAAFMVGAEVGPGVLCAKDKTGFWNGPAFFNMVGVDVGLQGGVSGKTMVIFLMDDEALEAALGGKLDISMGADIAIGRTADSTRRGAFDVQGNIYPIIYQAGAFGGMTLRTGAFIASHDFNKRYYGKKVSIRELLMTHKYDKPEADVLLLNLIGI